MSEWNVHLELGNEFKVETVEADDPGQAADLAQEQNEDWTVVEVEENE